MTRKSKKLTRNEGWYKVCIKGSKHGVTVDPDVSFEDLRSRLDYIESEYGEAYSKFKISKEIESGWYGDSDTTYYYVYGWRLETDKEFDARYAAQVKRDTQIVDRERVEYDRLSKKFAPKVEPKVEPWEDRMGGQFTEEEIRRSERGGDGW
jgi:hypothetical protein